MFTINRRETDQDISFFAIDPSGEVVGSLFAALEGTNLRLDSIQTNPPLRKHGIGGALFDALVGWARGKGATHLAGGEFKPDPFSSPKDVERFYAKRGVSIASDGNLTGDV